jgi:hypothetical protein
MTIGRTRYQDADIDMQYAICKHGGMREPIALIVPGYMNTRYKYEDNAAEIVPESYSRQLFFSEIFPGHYVVIE